MTDTARQEILNRINTALGRETRNEAVLTPAAGAETAGGSAAGPAGTPAFRTSGTADAAALVELLTDRLVDYNAGVYPVTAAEVPAQIAQLVTSAASVVVPADLPEGWLANVTAQVLTDSVEQPQPVDVLDGVDAVITGATVAIADTGTICLAGPQVGRRAITLIPDHHVVVLKVADIVEIVPQAVALLRERGLVESPQTWVSGPSATVDIELERVKGVHGPRTLDVLLVS